jgi:hypothetical protein
MGCEMEDAYKLFRIPMESLTWKILFDRVNSSEGISIEKKEKFWKALEFLKMELGKGFLNSCGTDHPICLKLENPCLKNDLLQFVETLQILKHLESNYPLLLKKLRSRIHSRNEGVFFVDIAGFYLHGNFDVYFIDEIQGEKTPDIRITDPVTKETFFIEVSRMDDSEERKRAGNEQRIIGNTFIKYGYDLLHSFNQLQHIDKAEIVRTVNKIKFIKDEVSRNKSFVHFNNGFIDMAVAHHLKAKEFNAWCAGNKRQSGIYGLSVDFNETLRILQHGKIRDKVKQLPADGSGLLYIPVHIIYFLFTDIAMSFALLSEEIIKYPRVLGIVLYADLGQSMDEKYIVFMEHAYTIKVQNGISRYRMYINNRSYKGGLHEQTIRRIKECAY